MNIFTLTLGAAGSDGDGGQLGLLLCESGIKLAPGFLQLVEGRFWFEALETGLPLGSAWPAFGFSLDDALVLVDVIVDVTGGVVFVVVAGVSAEMIRLILELRVLVL